MIRIIKSWAIETPLAYQVAALLSIQVNGLLLSNTEPRNHQHAVCFFSFAGKLTDGRALKEYATRKCDSSENDKSKHEVDSIHESLVGKYSQLN